MSFPPQDKENASPSQQQSLQLTNSLSTRARAQIVLDKGNLSFDSKLHVFNVKGLSGNTRVVALFPKPSCSCPSTGECYHILAAKLSIGMPCSSDKKIKKHLSQLRRNARKRKEKKCGRKRPRPYDVESHLSSKHF